MPDWSKIEKYGPSEISCHCGALYHSLAMFDGMVKKMLTQTPCPSCGKNDTPKRVSSPPERFTLGSDDLTRKEL